MVSNLEEDYVLTTCESCWKETEEVLFDGVNYVCVDCYERNKAGGFKWRYSTEFGGGSDASK